MTTIISWNLRPHKYIVHCEVDYRDIPTGKIVERISGNLNSLFGQSFCGENPLYLGDFEDYEEVFYYPEIEFFRRITVPHFNEDDNYTGNRCNSFRTFNLAKNWFCQKMESYVWKKSTHVDYDNHWMQDDIFVNIAPMYSYDASLENMGQGPFVCEQTYTIMGVPFK